MDSLLFLSLDIVKYTADGRVTIGSSIFILVFSMIVVFVVLLIISYMIDIMHFVITAKKPKKTKENLVVSNDNKNIMDDTILTATIAAAIASYMGTSSKNIRIKSIRRVEQNKSNWAIKSILK